MKNTYVSVFLSIYNFIEHYRIEFINLSSEVAKLVDLLYSRYH